MAYDKQKALTIAENEVGYLEKASNSQLDSKTANAGHGNYTKYARDLAKYPFYNGKKYGVAWCDVFVDWCFVTAYGKDAALALTFQPTKPVNNSGAGCKYSRDYYKAKGRLHSTPQPGDQIFFYSSDKKQIQHTGLVYKVDANRVYTIEGNTSGASGVISNGGGVCKKSYALNYSRLAGFGRPNWDAEDKEKAKQEEPKPTKPTTTAETYTTYTVKKGDSLWKIASKLLGNGNKYKRIQSANNLNGDLIRVGQKLKIPKG
jgi:LysM repeat protein